MGEDVQALDEGATRELFAAYDAVKAMEDTFGKADAARKAAKGALEEAVERRDSLLAELREGNTGMFQHAGGAPEEE